MSKVMAFKGEADVIVCDGFVGNVALKTSEGLAQMLASSLRSEFKRNWLTKIAALIAISVLNNFKKRFDHRRTTGRFSLDSREFPSRVMVRRTCWLLATRFLAPTMPLKIRFSNELPGASQRWRQRQPSQWRMSECMHV
jgi:hypothetical protein